MIFFIALSSCAFFQGSYSWSTFPSKIWLLTLFIYVPWIGALYYIYLFSLLSLSFRYFVLYYIGRYLLFDVFGGIDVFIFENIYDDILLFFGSSVVGINMPSCCFVHLSSLFSRTHTVRA